MTDRKPTELSDAELEPAKGAEGHNWINLLSLSSGISRPLNPVVNPARTGGTSQLAAKPLK